MYPSVFAFILSFVFGFQAAAARLTVVSPKRVLVDRQLDLREQFDVLTLTTKELRLSGLEFSVQNGFVHSIAGYTPKRVQLSQGGIRAFGWCYRLNGSEPDLIASRVQLKSDDELVWFYGYLEMDSRGTWTRECQPAASAANHISASKLRYRIQ